MSIEFENYAVVILSAGYSERMGSHKALLKFSKNLNFIEKITETYIDSGIKNICLVVNSDLFQHLLNAPFKQQAFVRIIENKIPEKLNWSAEDGGVVKEESKAIFISVWDHKQKETLRIDLWTKDMPLDEMKIFFHQLLFH